MDHVQRGSCEARFELRLTAEQKTMLAWLCRKLNRSGNAIVRELIEQRHSHERRLMLEQVQGTRNQIRTTAR